MLWFIAIILVLLCVRFDFGFDPITKDDGGAMKRLKLDSDDDAIRKLLM